jgi:hypothetical protein
MGIRLTPEEKFEIFGEGYQEYEDEAQERWGGTHAWEQSRQRTAELTKDDWIRIKAEGDEIMRRISAAVRGGVAADSGVAMDIAEAHRQHVCRNFYDCSYAMQRGLAEMFVADERFQATYEELAEGAARWFRDAVLANAERGERR